MGLWVNKDIRCLIDCVKMEPGYKYSRRLSIIVGTVLTVVSSLCIVFGIVGVTVGDEIMLTHNEMANKPVSLNMVAISGAMCSILVSITQ